MRKREDGIVCTTVSLRADDEYRSALYAYSRKIKQPVGDIVRLALDSYLGDSLAPLTSYYAGKSGRNIHRPKAAK